MRREERGGEEGNVLMDGGMSHTLPPKGGEGRVWGSSNPPHSCQPPPERGVDDGDGDSSSRTMSKTNTNHIRIIR